MVRLLDGEGKLVGTVDPADREVRDPRGRKTGTVMALRWNAGNPHGGQEEHANRVKPQVYTKQQQVDRGELTAWVDPRVEGREGRAGTRPGRPRREAEEDDE
ncbi:MAG TPA: hypothetical protein VKA83_25815 [Methylomirabilota bacterium]|nr:hypothetical protein [Methylomirabilota bacterium]